MSREEESSAWLPAILMSRFGSVNFKVGFLMRFIAIQYSCAPVFVYFYVSSLRLKNYFSSFDKNQFSLIDAFLTFKNLTTFLYFSSRLQPEIQKVAMSTRACAAEANMYSRHVPSIATPENGMFQFPFQDGCLFYLTEF